MATKLHKMRQYCSSVLRGGGGGGYARCRTYEAFAAALQGCLRDIVAPVRETEALIVQNGATMLGGGGARREGRGEGAGK